MFRVRLGKHTVGDNKVVNGDFSTGDLSGWEEAYGFFQKDSETITPGRIFYINEAGTDAAAMYENSSVYLLIQRGILERGKEYRISFDILISNPTSVMALKIGDWGKEMYKQGSHTVDRLVLDRGDLVFNPYGVIVWTNISAYELQWNDPLKDEPINLQDISTSITQSEDIEGLFVEFVDNLDFVGDGYEFLVQQRNSQGVNGVVPILIEESEHGDSWRKIFQGSINITDITFNEERKIATAEINDSSTPALIMNNLNTEVPLASEYAVSWFENFPSAMPLHLQVSYSPYVSFLRDISYTVEGLFAYVVNFITGSRALVLSDVFGDPERYGNHIISSLFDFENTEHDFNMTFSRLFEIVNSVYNITITFCYPENVPVIYISQKEDVSTEEIYMSFSDTRITSRKFINNFVKDIETGYETSDSDNEVPLEKFTADKINVQGSKLILSPPGIYVDGAGGYDIANASDGDVVLVEAVRGVDQNSFNNDGEPEGVPPDEEIINYYRPYIQAYWDKIIPNETIKDPTFPLSNWINSLPFTFVGVNNNQARIFEKTNRRYLEEITFEYPISRELWNNFINDNAGYQYVPDPCFNHPSAWITFGDVDINGDSQAHINNFSQGAGFSTLFRNPLEQGKKYRARVRIQGWSTSKDNLIGVYLTDVNGDPSVSIGDLEYFTFINGPNTYIIFEHIYDLFFIADQNNFYGIGVFTFSDGADPQINLTVLQLDLFESIPIRNVNKLIQVNGSVCKILEIERDIKTGLSQITALKEYENAN